MQPHTVPFDINTEDKIIGGYVSLRQFFWLFVPIITLIALFVVNKNYIEKTQYGLKVVTANIIWRLIVVLILAVISIIMAFVKINGENADKHLLNIIQYKTKQHIYESK